MEGLDDNQAHVAASWSDAAVIERSIGEAEFFAAIFDRHYDTMRIFCERRIGHEAGIDVAADVFLAAFISRDRFDVTRPSALPWLFGIATNLIRRHRRDEATRLRAIARLAGSSTPQSWDGERSAIAAADVALVLRAIEAMRARDRDVLLLFAWADLSYEEIAESLGIAPGTVRSRLFRARRKLIRMTARDASEWGGA